MGSRHFDPIYEAAQAGGLPIFSHVSGADLIYLGLPQPAGGFPESYSERRCAFSQIAEANLGSLIFSGTFERFPELRVVFAEFGFTWALSLMWRMDSTWRSTRIEVPWVNKWPSEYVHERVRFTTQPVDEPRRAEDIYELIKLLGDDVLLFSTDYPHWDTDNPTRVLQGLSNESKDRLYSANPLGFWRL
jgi:predicted TIM-barrel fold metal-dependent hydrolase